jgi:hypothetical protein
MLSFAFKRAINATSLNALLGYKKKGSFPLFIIKKKKPPPPKSSDLSILQTKYFFLAHQSEIFNSFSNQKDFTSIPLFLGCWNFGSVGRGRRFLL